MKAKAKNGNKVYEVITNKIVDLLEQGTVPWRKPRTNGPAARSYRGYDPGILLEVDPSQKTVLFRGTGTARSSYYLWFSRRDG